MRLRKLLSYQNHMGTKSFAWQQEMKTGDLKILLNSDLPQYTIPHELQPQKRKRKQSGSVLLSPKRQKVDGKRKTDKPVAPPPPAKKKCPPRKVVSKPSPQPRKEKSGHKEVVIDSDLILLLPEESVVPEWYQSGIFNPLGEETQRCLCRQLRLRFIKSNRCTGGGMDVPLRAPRSMHRIQGDGNCLFRAFSYAITGSERQHLFLRRAIIHYMRTTDECMRLLAGYLVDVTIEDYIQRTCIDEEGTSGSQIEMYVLAHMTGLISFNTQARMYAYTLPGHIDQELYPDDLTRPAIYIQV